MRTSLSRQIQTSLMYMDVASNRLVESQTRAVSGKRILRPSDDVPGTNRGLTLRSAINTNDQFTNNIVVSTPLVAATDNAIADIIDAVKSVRDIAVAAATPDVTGSAKTSYLAQLDDILGQMVDVANTKHLDQYVFSGTATTTPPLRAQSGSQPYAYAGNSGVRRTQVLQWVTLPVNIPGDRLFNFDGSAGNGTTDVFTMVTRLRDAVASGSAKDISGQLDNVDANLDNLLTCSAQLGSWAARMERAEEVLGDTKVRLQEMLSDTEDTDLPQAVVALKTQENVYQAALAISGRMLDLSLASLQYTT